jgi:peptide/nickel transport system substrate-binding protein
MKKQLRLVLGLLIAFACLISLTGCRTAPQSSGPAANSSPQQTIGKRGGSLVYRISQPLKTLSYYMADDEPSVIVTFFLLNDRLINFDHEKQAHVPLLAESYTPGPDGLTYDVTLREGVKFSDGRPITSADVEFTLKSIYDERTATPILRTSMLVGGKEITARVVDDRKIQLVFPEKIAAAENYLENLAVMPKHALEADMQAGKLGEAWKITADPASVVTSGPFMVDSVQAGERISLKRNPHYWKKDDAGTQLPYLDGLVIEVVADPNNTLARLQQNTIDLVDRVRTTDYAALRSADGAVKAYDAGPGLGTDHMWFNLNPSRPAAAGSEGQTNAITQTIPLDNTPKFKWFSDKRFRRAIAHAIDRNSISTNTLQGLATPLFGFVPAGNKAWLDPNLPKKEYDLERARALLTEAGFTARDNGGRPELYDAAGNRIEFTLIVPAENEPRKLMAAVIQEDLAKLGINMQIAPIDQKGVTERWSTTYDYDAILLGTTQTGTDPSGFATFLKSSGTAHQWRPKQQTPATEWEAKIDALMTSLSQTSDKEERKRMFNEIQAIMADETPVISIVSRHTVTAANSRIGNLAPGSFLPYSLWNADRLFIRQ